ncbi:MAG: hypothetical protein V5B78_04900 [Desulfohalobiaceae bacterium]
MEEVMHTPLDPRSGAAHSGWQRFKTNAGTGILAIPDEGGYRAILERPRIMRTDSDRPSFSATLELERQPGPDENNLAPLVRGALVMLEVEIAPRKEQLAELSQREGSEFRALFPRESAWWLQKEGKDEPLAGLAISGFSTLATVEARLDVEVARAFLSAVSGQESDLSVEVELGYRTQGAELPAISFSMDLQAVYDRLSEGAGPEGYLWEKDLINYLADMLKTGVITAESTPPNTWVDQLTMARAALERFLSSARFILLRSEEGDDPDLGARYKLKIRPGGPMTFRFRISGRAPGLEHKTITAPLGNLLRDALSGEPLDPYLHFVGPGGNSGRWREIPRLMKGIPESGARSGPRRTTLAAVGGNIVDVGMAVRPSTHVAVPAHHLMTAEAIRPEIAHWAVGEVAIEAQDSATGQALPIVKKGDEPLWPDRRNDGDFWYAPEFTVIMPAETDTADGSPFLFTFKAKGYDLSGTPGLEATVRLDLRTEMPADARREWQRRGRPKSRAVPTDNLSVELQVPVRLSGGEIRTERFPADSVQRNGNRIRATFSLLDDWARATYGALALDGYQDEPVCVSVAYTFPCYQPVGDRMPSVSFGGKRIGVPVARTREEIEALKGRVHLDAAKKAVHFRGAELKLRKEKFRLHRAVRRPAASHTMVATAVPATAIAVQPQTTSVLPQISPQVVDHQAILEALKKKKYTKGRHGKTVRPEAFIPCTRFGSLYVEQEEDTMRAVGCLAPSELGRPDPSRYSLLEIPEAKDEYRVYRSLRTPGRFLVVPKAYRIGRFEPGMGDRAYRPTILLYSAIDAENVSNSRCVITATLVADMPAWRRRVLLSILRERHHSDPTLEWPTELSGDMTFNWALPDSGADGPLQLEVDAVRQVDGFRVSLTTDALGVPVLQEILSTSGVNGSFRIRLVDGSTIDSTLAMELGRVIGPDEAGPISVMREGNGVKLQNHTEAPADVSDFLVEEGGHLRRISVEEHLPAGDEMSVNPSSVPTGEIDPIYSLRRTDGGLEEIRSYIEDISVGAVFINLLDMQGRGLASLEIFASIRGLEGKQSIVLDGESDVGELEFLLPLTKYLDKPVLEFRVRRVTHEGRTEESQWREWNLTDEGSVIGLNWEWVG